LRSCRPPTLSGTGFGDARTSSCAAGGRTAPFSFILPKLSNETGRTEAGGGALVSRGCGPRGNAFNGWVEGGLDHIADGAEVDGHRVSPEQAIRIALGGQVNSSLFNSASQRCASLSRERRGTRFTADQIRIINLIVNELTANGVVEPARLYESPYTDHAPRARRRVPENEVDNIVPILNTVKANAAPTDAA